MKWPLMRHTTIFFGRGFYRGDDMEDDGGIGWRRRMARFFVNLALFLIVSALCVAVLESLVRYSYGIPIGGADPWGEIRGYHKRKSVLFKKSTIEGIGYEHRPHVRTYFMGTHIETNSHGMRDIEYSVKKPPGTYRIAVLGDSVAFGLGVNMTYVFTEVLESRLNERGGRKVEVLNFGVSGYSTKREVAQYDAKVRYFDPDLVIIAYSMNDIFHGTRENRGFDKEYFPVWEHLYLLDYYSYIMSELADRYVGIPSIPLAGRSQVKEDIELVDYYIKQEMPVLIVMFPHLKDLDDYKLNARRIKVINNARDRDIPLVDLLELYRGLGPERLKRAPNDYYHPNELGHEIAANATYDYLIEEGIVS